MIDYTSLCKEKHSHKTSGKTVKNVWEKLFYKIRKDLCRRTTGGKVEISFATSEEKYMETAMPSKKQENEYQTDDDHCTDDSGNLHF